MGVLSSLFGKSLADYISENNINKVKGMIDAGADVNKEINDKGVNLLMYAIIKNVPLEMIKVLLNAGANVNKEDIDGFTALFFAAGNEKNSDSLKIIDALLEADANINHSSKKGITPLMLAANNKGSETVNIVNKLLNRGANINNENNNGRNALLVAARFANNIEVIDILLKEGSNPFEEDNYEENLYDNLKSNDNINSDSEKYKELEKLCAPIEDFSQKCNINLIEKRYEYTDINEKDNSGTTVLMYALKYNREIGIIKSIIEHGAKINIKSNAGTTALMYALRYNCEIDIINLIIENDAKINIRSNDGTTALMYAAGYHSNVEIIDLLINSGANIKSRNKNGSNVSSFAAAFNKNKKMINKLMKLGAQVDDKIIIKAINNSINNNYNVEVIESLLEIDVDFDINMQFFEDMSTVLINAAKESKDPEVIELLLDHGADGSIQDLELNTAFDYAQNNKHIKDTDVFWQLNDSQYN